MGQILTSSVAIKLIDEVSKPARTVAQALRDAVGQMKNVSKSMGGSGSAMGEAFKKRLADLNLTKKELAQVRLEWLRYDQAQRAALGSDWMKKNAAGVRAWKSQVISATKAARREQIAESKTTAAIISGGKGAIAGRGRKFMSETAREFASGMVMGSIPMMAGMKAYEGGKHAIEQGAEYQHLQVGLRNMGMTVDQMAEINEAARKVSRESPGTSINAALAQIKETIGAFGSVEHAVENASTLAKINQVLKASGREGGLTGDAEQAQNFVRYFEERGVANNQERFTREAKEQARAMSFFGEKYNPSEMLQFAQQAKSTLVSYNERFAAKIVPSLVTMLGGPRAGTAASMFDKTIMGRVNDKLQAQEWMRLGLLDPSKVIMKAGHAVAWKPGAVKNTEKAMRDPLAWMIEDQLPAMAKGGYNINDLLSLRKGFGLLYRNTSANLFASDLGLPASRARLLKDEELQNRAGDFDSIHKRIIEEDPRGGAAKLSSAMDTLETAALKSAPIASALDLLSAGLMKQADLITHAGEKWRRILGGPETDGTGSLKNYEDRYDLKRKISDARNAPAFSKTIPTFQAMPGAGLIKRNWAHEVSEPFHGISPNHYPAFSRIEGTTPHGSTNIDYKEADLAKASIDQAGQAIRELDGQTAKVTVDADTGPAMAKIAALKREIAGISSSISAAVNAVKAPVAANMKTSAAVARNNYVDGGVQGGN